MLERIKNAVLSYYLLTFKQSNGKVTFQQREKFVKKLLNRVFYATGFFGVIFILSTVLNYGLIAKFVFPFFMLSLIPYFIYGIMVKLLHNEKGVNSI
jgi:hypothetical protein